MTSAIPNARRAQSSQAGPSRTLGYRLFNHKESKPSSYDNKKHIGTKLYVSFAYYFAKRGLLFVGFLTRQIYSYSAIENRTIYLDKVEEYRNDSDFISKIKISRKAFTSHYYIFLMEKYSRVKIFKASEDCPDEEFLKSSIGGGHHLLFDQEIEEVAIVFKVRGIDLVYTSSTSEIGIVSETKIDEFEVVETVRLGQEFVTITITALDYAQEVNQLFIGTNIGQFYLYDVDIRSIIYKAVDFGARILDIQFISNLENVYIFTTEGIIRVFDTLTHQIVQEIKTDIGVQPANFIYFTDFENFFDNDVAVRRNSRKSIIGGSLRLADAISKRMALRRLDGKIKKSWLGIIFGNSTLCSIRITIRKTKEIDELLPMFKASTLENRPNLLKNAVKPNDEIVFSAISEDRRAIILVNQRNIIMYYSFGFSDIGDRESEKDCSYCTMMRLKGDIVRIWIPTGNKFFYLATSKGSLYKISTRNMDPSYEFHTPLEFVTYSDLLSETYQFLMVNAPNEIYAIRKPKLSQKITNIEELINGVNSEGIKLKTDILGSISIFDCLVILQEDFIMLFFRKKNFKLARQIDLNEELISTVYLKSESPKIFKILVGEMYTKGHWGLYFEDGMFLIAKFNPKGSTDVNFYFQKIRPDSILCFSGQNELLELSEDMKLEIFSIHPEEQIGAKEFSELKANRSMRRTISMHHQDSPFKGLNREEITKIASIILNKSGVVLGRHKSVSVVNCSRFEDVKEMHGSIEGRVLLIGRYGDVHLLDLRKSTLDDTLPCYSEHFNIIKQMSVLKKLKDQTLQPTSKHSILRLRPPNNH